MIVVIANDIPNIIRGKMKLFFIEIKPNVFISGVNDFVGTRIVNYLFSKTLLNSSGMIIIKSINKFPGYEIISNGYPKKETVLLTGMQLIKEK